jgi:CHAT domain-containing protein
MFRFLASRYAFLPMLFFIFAIFIIQACAGPKMSVEEAEQVTISMSKLSYVPPPRRIDDILSFLKQPDQLDPIMAERLKILMDMSPPETSNEMRLARFFLERGERAARLARSIQAIEDRRLALYYAERSGINNSRYMNRLGLSEISFGNYKRGITLLEQSMGKGYWASGYSNLVRAYAFTGDLERAENLKNEGVNYCNRLRGTWPKIHSAWMIAWVLEAHGKYSEAEKYFRSAQNRAGLIAQSYPLVPVAFKTHLAQNLMKQKRLTEAEFEMRLALKKSIKLFGKKSWITGTIIGDLGEILHHQGRLKDAEKLLKAGIQIMEESSEIPNDSFIITEALMRLGHILADQQKYYQAMAQYEIGRVKLSNNQYLFNRGLNLARNPNFILSLIKTGRTMEAMEVISNIYKINRNNLGDRNYLTAEILALRGIVNMDLKRPKQAIKDFSDAIPILLEENIARKANFSDNQRFRIIVESNIDLLAQIHGSPLEGELGIEALAEAFRLADAIRGHIVQSALTASGARIAAASPEFADLVRKEQNAQQQIVALQSTISNALVKPENQQDPESIKNLMVKLNALKNAQAALLDEIKGRFPRYSDFTTPQPATVAIAQEYLKQGEALISIYSSENSTYLWALDHRGNVKFAIANIGRKRTNQIVSQLRRALDAEPDTLGDIPEFDLKLAFEFYKYFLEPVKVCWENAAELIIVAQGPLSHLPFSILPTSISEYRKQEHILYGKYQKVPWLIRKVAITRLPSVSSMVTLRMLPGSDFGRKAFIGFGDPIFNHDQLTIADNMANTHIENKIDQEKVLSVRGIRITEEGNLDSEKIITSHLSLLNRIPDTAEEIKSIAKVLGADVSKDIFLGKRASEFQVKNMNLSDRRVIAFATHSLVPGDLDGLVQPALALSSPIITEENEDGLLTMEEIFKLRLNADWVLLSACNTASGAGAGAEAISGLGRAFFYAGTRALLVSMWPVESSSAKELTTNLFRYQKKDKKLNRSKALRKSMLKLIDGPGLKDDITGKRVASYAHPIFWAPFIIVGDNGSYNK